jgi:hypothetical protein
MNYRAYAARTGNIIAEPDQLINDSCRHHITYV